jgi:hypothetical protein
VVSERREYIATPQDLASAHRRMHGESSAPAVVAAILIVLAWAAWIGFGYEGNRRAYNDCISAGLDAKACEVWAYGDR